MRSVHDVRLRDGDQGDAARGCHRDLLRLADIRHGDGAVSLGRKSAGGAGPRC